MLEQIDWKQASYDQTMTALVQLAVSRGGRTKRAWPELSEEAKTHLTRALLGAGAGSVLGAVHGATRKRPHALQNALAGGLLGGLGVGAGSYGLGLLEKLRTAADSAPSASAPETGYREKVFQDAVREADKAQQRLLDRQGGTTHSKKDIEELNENMALAAEYAVHGKTQEDKDWGQAKLQELRKVYQDSASLNVGSSSDNPILKNIGWHSKELALKPFESWNEAGQALAGTGAGLGTAFVAPRTWAALRNNSIIQQGFKQYGGLPKGVQSQLHHLQSQGMGFGGKPPAAYKWLGKGTTSFGDRYSTARAIQQASSGKSLRGLRYGGLGLLGLLAPAAYRHFYSGYAGQPDAYGLRGFDRAQESSLSAERAYPTGASTP